MVGSFPLQAEYPEMAICIYMLPRMREKEIFFEKIRHPDNDMQYLSTSFNNILA